MRVSGSPTLTLLTAMALAVFPARWESLDGLDICFAPALMGKKGRSVGRPTQSRLDLFRHDAGRENGEFVGAAHRFVRARRRIDGKNAQRLPAGVESGMKRAARNGDEATWTDGRLHRPTGVILNHHFAFAADHED